MAMTDSNLLFVGGVTGSAISITSSAVRSTGILDLATGLMNTGSTYATSPVSTGNATVFGEDLSIGPRKFDFVAWIGTAFAGGTSLNIAIQGAVDASSGTYPANLSGLTWTTYAETGAVPVAVLTANGKIPLPDWPHRQIGAALPRFISLLFTPVGTFSGGTITTAGMFMPAPHNPGGLYPSGFSVGA